MTHRAGMTSDEQRGIARPNVRGGEAPEVIGEAQAEDEDTPATERSATLRAAPGQPETNLPNPFERPADGRGEPQAVRWPSPSASAETTPMSSAPTAPTAPMPATTSVQPVTPEVRDGQYGHVWGANGSPAPRGPVLNGSVPTGPVVNGQALNGQASNANQVPNDPPTNG